MGTYSYTIMLVIEIMLAALLLYSIYKVIWYICKLCALSHKIRRLKKKGCTVVCLRSGLGRVFGARGKADYRIITRSGVFEVSVITFISTHSRWNIQNHYTIENNQEGYLIDVRRYNKMFYKAERHSERPDHAMDFRRESRITLTRLTLPPRDEDMHPEDRRILLVYPKPQLLTRTTTRMDYLDPGSRLEDFEIMYLHNLLDAIDQAQNHANGH